MLSIFTHAVFYSISPVLHQWGRLWVLGAVICSSLSMGVLPGVGVLALGPSGSQGRRLPVMGGPDPIQPRFKDSVIYVSVCRGGGLGGVGYFKPCESL